MLNEKKKIRHGNSRQQLNSQISQERLKRQREQAEDEAALSALEAEKQQRLADAREDAKRRRLAEHQLRRSRKRGDPNNPSKEEMDAQQVCWS
jgi:hypothetical protein